MSDSRHTEVSEFELKSVFIAAEPSDPTYENQSFSGAYKLTPAGIIASVLRNDAFLGEPKPSVPSESRGRGRPNVSDTVGLLAMLVPGTVLVGGTLAWARRGSNGPTAPRQTGEPLVHPSDQPPARWLPIFLVGVGFLMVLMLAVLLERPLSLGSISGVIAVLGPGLLGLIWLASRGFLK